MKLPEQIMRHSIGVAEFMSEYAETHPPLNPYVFYVTGLLHDIGKLYPGDPDPAGKNHYKGHAHKGGELLENMGLATAKAIKHHGHPEDDYFSIIWLILNLADLSVNGKGEVIPIRARLKNIKDRYGKFSEEYENATKIVNILISHNIIRSNGTII